MIGPVPQGHMFRLNGTVSRYSMPSFDSGPSRESNLLVKHSSAVISLSLALITSVAIICGILTYLLSWIGGANPANAALRGGAALGGACAIGIALLAALNVL